MIETGNLQQINANRVIFFRLAACYCLFNGIDSTCIRVYLFE